MPKRSRLTAVQAAALAIGTMAGVLSIWAVAAGNYVAGGAGAATIAALVLVYVSQR
jgi:hypothetical protein